MDNWGKEIKVNGKRPAWFRDSDSPCPAKSNHGTWYVDGHPQSLVAPGSADWIWRGVTAIRLPAGHFAYKALDAGFEPWGGGDAAPTDWDGGKVLLANGDTEHGSTLLQDRTNPGSNQWSHRTPVQGVDIIGYRKRVTAQPDLPPALKIGIRRVERVETIVLTEKEVADILRSHFGFPDIASVLFDETGDATITNTTADEA